MNTPLNDALMLTFIGMGMTFAAIGLLVGGMYALAALIKDRAKGSQDIVTPPPPSHTQQKDAGTGEAQHIAAAAAVSLALASQSDKTIAAVASVATALAAQPAATTVSSGTPTAWNTYARGQHLTQRKFYDVRRLYRLGPHYKERK